MIVSITETISEPRQPKQFEQKAHPRYFALEAQRRSCGLALSSDFRSPPIWLFGFLVSP